MLSRYLSPPLRSIDLLSQPLRASTYCRRMSSEFASSEGHEAWMRKEWDMLQAVPRDARAFVPPVR